MINTKVTAIVWTLVLCWFVAWPAAAQDSALTASVDRTEVSVDETLTLRVRYTGQVDNGQPDFTQLKQHFDIISQARSNEISVVNGRMESFTEWRLTIAPKRQGTLLIPSFRYQGEFSNAIQIKVTEPTAAPDQLGDIFVETEVDKTKIHVQEQIVLTYRLYTRRSIDSLDAEPLQIDGVRIEELPQARYQRSVDGTTYGVLEVRYALFPQTSDTFTIPRLRWTLRVVTAPNSRGFGFGTGRYDLKSLLTDSQVVEVLPRPDAYPDEATWLPASDVELTQEWSAPLSDFRAGEPLTRTLTLRARGLTAAQLPPLPVDENLQGFKLYADQPQQQTETTDDGVIGIRSESMAVVPSATGELTLPAVEVRWWNTEADQLEVARLPAQTIYVQGGARQAQVTDQAPEPEVDTIDTDARPPTPDTGSDRSGWLWPALSALFALLWLVFALLWWRARRRPWQPSPAAKRNPPHQAEQSGEKQAFKTVQSAAAYRDVTHLRALLLQWASQRWRDDPPRTLHDLADAIGDESVGRQLEALNAAVYANRDAHFDGAALSEALGNWRKEKAARRPDSARNLKPLYR